MMKNITFSFFFIGCLVGCSQIIGTSNDHDDFENSVTADGVIYKLRINQNAFNEGDSLKVGFIALNNSIHEKEYFFANQQQFGLQIFNDSGENVYSFPIIVQPATSRFTLNHGESKTYAIYVLTDSFHPETSSTQAYRLTGFLLGDYPRVSIDFTVD